MATKKKTAYPYPDMAVLLDPVIAAMKRAVAGEKVTRVKRPVPFDRPVHHICDSSLPFGSGEAVEKLIRIAFQYGVCQGYAMRDGEADDEKWLASIRAQIEG